MDDAHSAMAVACGRDHKRHRLSRPFAANPLDLAHPKRIGCPATGLRLPSDRRQHRSQIFIAVLHRQPHGARAELTFSFIFNVQAGKGWIRLGGLFLLYLFRNGQPAMGNPPRVLPSGKPGAFSCRNASVVAMVSDGTFSIRQTAQIVRVTTTNIARFALDGGLIRVFQLAEVPGYAGLRQNPGEVKSIANPDVLKETSPAHCVVERLEIFRAVTKALLLTVSRNGTAQVTVRLDAVEQGIGHLSEPAASEPGCNQHLSDR